MLSPQFLQRLEDQARRHPGKYKARVALLAGLGYVYLAGMVLVLLAVTVTAMVLVVQHSGVAVLAKVGLPLLALVGMIVSSMWVSLAPPKGLALRPADAPALFAEIERVRAALGAPRVHKVLLVDEHNAAIAQHPRWGLFGGYQVYLILGLQLMASLSPDEFRAVLAHEFGHAFRAHGRLGTWIFRVQRTWVELMAELDQEKHWGQGLFRRFFHWYVPYLGAYTRVLDRAQEFEADRLAESCAPGFSGSALVRLELSQRYLERVFWPDVISRTRTDSEPPSGVIHALVARVSTAAAHERAPEWLDEAMREETHPGSTHPALRDRLASLGYEPRPLPPIETTAAQAMLGARLAFVTEQFGHQWQVNTRYHWQGEHQKATQVAARLAALEARATEEELAPSEVSERIWLTAEVHGQEMAIPMARAFLDAAHEDASVHFVLGRALADKDDAGALPHLEHAVALDRESTIPACVIAARLLRRLGRDDEAAAYQARAEAFENELVLAGRERSVDGLTPRDVFLPHGLDDEALAAVVDHVAQPGIKRAYLVRKDVVHFPEQPLFLLLIETRWAAEEQFWSSARKPDRLNRLMEGLPLPGGFIVMRADSRRNPFRKPVQRVRGAGIYDAKARAGR